MNRQSSSLRRPQSPACRALLALGTLLGALAGSTVAVEAQLTALGAHVLTECAGPGDCAEFDRFGFALAVCDFDDDGFDDLAVGVPGETVGPNDNAGSLHVFHGSVAGLTDTGDQAFDLDDLDLSGGADAGDHFGRALAAGDFDLDGICDLAVGAPGKSVGAPGNHAGAALVFFGSTSGLELDGFRFLSQNDLPPGSSESAESNDSFGDALAALPDGGLAIGVPDEDFVLITESDAGLIHLLSTSGPGDPLDSVVDREQNDYLDACPEGNGNEDGWGATLAVGQFGEDPSLAVAGALKAVSGEDNAGRVTVIGSPTGCFDQDRAGVLETAEELDLFGQALAAGDFDDDGFEDLAVGVPGEDLPDTADGRAGLVQVLFGSAVGLTVSGDLALSQYDFPLGQESGDSDDRFGQALAAGDFDGDGFSDLAIGVPFENVGAVVDAGAFHVAYGGSSGFVAAEGQTFHSNLPASMPDSPNTGDDLGGALATGDFDGNGIDDLAVGMSGEGLGSAAEAGAVTVLYGLDRATGGFGEVHFTSSIAVPEVTANRIVSIVRTGGAVVAASVTHSRTGGSAAPGSDFTYTSEVESWGAGELGPELTTVHVVGDTLDEGDETIVLSLSSPSAGLAIGTPSTFTLTIEDDDEGGVVEFADLVQVFFEDVGSAGIVVTRAAGAASAVTVHYATSNASATAGEDYVAQSGTLTFGADETSKTISVALVDDIAGEPAETFQVTLSNPGGGSTLGVFTVLQAVIVDDDIFRDDLELGDTSRWSTSVP